MNTPSSGTWNLAAPRIGLLQRLAVGGAVLAAEAFLLSVLIQNAPLGELSGAPRLLHLIHHWAFRFMIAYAMSLAILLYLRRGDAVGLISAAAGGTPLRTSWLLAHAVLLIVLAGLSSVLYVAGPLPFAALALAWNLCGLGAALSLFAALAPRQTWLDALRSTGSLPLFATLPAAAALAVYNASQLLWKPAATVTFRLVLLLLHPLLPALRSDASTLTLITDRVAIEVSETCSGLEGVGLMLVFCAAWLWVYRREYIFPRALIIVPGAVLFIFLLNALRIAALVLIADAGHVRIAIEGFHSEAGWIAFNLAAFSVAIAAKNSAWLNRPAAEHRIVSGAAVTGAAVTGAAGAHADRAGTAIGSSDGAAPGSPDGTAAYLMPLLAILASGMIVRALSAGFDLLYPVRLVSAAVVLWAFRRSYRSLNWRFSWRGVVVGVAVFCAWAALARFFYVPAVEPEQLAGLAPALRNAWIVCRAAAAILTVPIAEELAFRGYLMRRIAKPEFEMLPLTAVGVPALVISAIAFGVTHGGMWLGGIAAGLAYGLIAIKTGKIGEAVAAHATTNALIAIEVILFGQWQLW